MRLLPHTATWRRSRSRVLVTVAAALALTAALLAGTAHSAEAATLLSQGQTATASSAENASFPASAAMDGNTGTRWSSPVSDPQWLRVDLGSSQTICEVTLAWEAAYATAFQIQVSPDGTNWTTVYSTTTGTGGTQTLSVSGTGRYVRMYGTARATPYGYSLWELGVYTTGSGTGPTPTPTPTPTSTGSGGGTGAPPASFWGNTSAIPAATHVLELSIVNQTNGQYPATQAY